MSPRTNIGPERVSLSQSRPTSLVLGVSNMASKSHQDDDLSSQDSLSLSSFPTAHGTSQDIKDWNMNTTESLNQAVSSKESPQMQMLSFSLPQQLMTPTVGPNDMMYTGVDFPAVPDLHDHDLPRDFYSFVNLSSMDNDACLRANSPSDALSVAHSAHAEDGQLITTTKTWSAMMSEGQYPDASLDQFSSGLFQTIPVSPPLTEASNDLSVTSSCSHPGFPSFMATDDSFLGEFNASPIGINPADPPLFPAVPLSDNDPNRTIRPSKQPRRATLPTSLPQAKTEQEIEMFSRPRSKDGAEARNPREHHYYSLPTHSDGKYYCPFAGEETPCNHAPTTQKCAYQQVPNPQALCGSQLTVGSKYLDSHLKPYRCKVPTCIDAQLRFSSNACLFRHEREAHGLHGHGDNPHLCFWEGCERSIPGYGFPRRWNLYDHMRRVHDYTASERHSSPETAASAAPAKKKEATNRKKKVTGVTPTPTMKRTRSVHSQIGSVKATRTSAHHGQRLQSAERSYYKCRERLLQELGKITPQDTSLHEKAKTGLQELFTLALNYRHLEASQTGSQVPNGMAV